MVFENKIKVFYYGFGQDCSEQITVIGLRCRLTDVSTRLIVGVEVSETNTGNTPHSHKLVSI